MASIGERLEEARKRQGISLREAAEATKIRSDFLQSLENNQFEFDLPDVYRRGFLKLYARFLKLDTEKVMTDYNAVLLGSSKVAKRENREVFGRMDLPESTKPIGGADSEPPFGAHQHPGRASEARPAPSGGPADAMETQSDSGLYWKIGLIFVGGFAIVGLIFLLVQAIVGGSSGDDAAPLPDQPVASSDAEPTTAATNDSNRGAFKIIANDDVLNVMVRQDIDRKKLFGQSMSAGEEITIDREGPVRVVSSDIDKITIELNGKRITSPSSGIGQIKLGMQGPEN